MPADLRPPTSDSSAAQDFSGEPLGIDPVQLLKVTDDACTLIQEYRDEMGILLGNPEPRAHSWAARRRAYRSEYAGSFYHRTGLGGFFNTPGGNLSLGFPARVVRVLAATFEDDMTGTDPFIAIMPKKVADKDTAALSKQVEARAQDEISRSNLRAILAESIRVALTENERPIKLGWTTEKTQRPELRAVAVFPPAPEEEEFTAEAQRTQRSEDGGEGDVETAIPGVDDAIETHAAPKLGVGAGRADGANMTGEEVEGEEVPSEQSTDQQINRSTNSAQPIRTPGGAFIFEKDDFITTLIDAQGAFKGLYVQGAEIPEGLSVQIRLKKEASFVLTAEMLGADGKPVFQIIPGLMGTDVQKDSLEAFGLKMEDFIYDIKAPTLDHSDLQCHVYDDDLDDVLAAYRVAEDPTERYLNLRANRRPTETAALSAASQGVREAGERLGNTGSAVRKRINVHETYYRVRLRPEDLHKTWVFLVIDFQKKVPLHAEYLGNMRMKKPPIRLLRGLESEPGRAYGVGVYQKFFDRNLAIDFWFNRNRLKTTKESSADFMFPDAFQNAQDAQAFTFGSKTVYALKMDANGREFGPDHPPVFRVNLHEMTEKEWEIIEKLIQSGQLEFGIVSMGDLASSGAGIGKDGTATATRNIERTGNLLQRTTENMMACDITEICQMAIDIILENADLPAAEFTPGGELLAGMNRDEIRDLPREVRLLLTKARSAESLETNTQVKTTIAEYDAMTKRLQKKSRFAYINILKSLDVQDADDVLVEPTDEEVQAEAVAMSKPPDEPPPEKVSIKFENLLPSEQAQALEEIGIKADPSRTAGPAAGGVPGVDVGSTMLPAPGTESGEAAA